jgi:hypothetical protein
MYTTPALYLEFLTQVRGWCVDGAWMNGVQVRARRQGV